MECDVFLVKNVKVRTGVNDELHDQWQESQNPESLISLLVLKKSVRKNVTDCENNRRMKNRSTCFAYFPSG